MKAFDQMMVSEIRLFLFILLVSVHGGNVAIVKYKSLCFAFVKKIQISPIFSANSDVRKIDNFWSPLCRIHSRMLQHHRIPHTSIHHMKQQQQQQQHHTRRNRIISKKTIANVSPTHCVTMNARIQVIFLGSITSVCLDLTQTSWSPPCACVANVQV